MNEIDRLKEKLKKYNEWCDSVKYHPILTYYPDVCPAELEITAEDMRKLCEDRDKNNQEVI
jgi:cytochrome oxidase Cu insertion factor (SCO1/SenC/PrrC family)